MGQLKIEGRNVVRLTLIKHTEHPNRPASEIVLAQPRPTVSLPAGTYELVTIEVADAHHRLVCSIPQAIVDGRTGQVLQSRERVIISPDKPAVLSIGSPLTPRVNVFRHGQTFFFSYQLFDAGGHNYRWDRLPAVTIFSSGRRVGSGSPEYG
jgi:hypothetical protein